MAQFSCGLDISDLSVELISLKRRGGQIGVDRCARMAMPAGLVQHGIIQDAASVGIVLRKLLDQAFGRRRGHVMIGLALPESVTYAKRLKLPASLNRVLSEKAALMQAAEALPISMADAVYDIISVGRDEDVRESLLLAAERSVIDGYVEALAAADASVLFIDSEAMASAEALVAADDERVTMIVDVGARATTMTILAERQVKFSASAYVGGDQLTHDLEKALKLPLDEAERIKIKIGLDPRAKGGKVLRAMIVSVEEIIAEIRRTAEFFAREFNRPVERVVLTGGTSQMIGFREALQKRLPSADITTADPFQGIDLSRLPQQERLQQTGALYACAIGLARRVGGYGRAGPQVDLNPTRHRSWLESLDRFRQKLLSGIHMVRKTQAKKTTTTRRRRTKKEIEEAAVKPVIEVEAMTEEAPVKKKAVLEEEMAVPAVETMEQPSVVPSAVSEEPLPVEEAVKFEEPAPTPVVPENTVDEPDFGQNVGELLGQGEAETKSATAAPSELDLAGGGELRIDEILERKKTGFVAKPEPSPIRSLPLEKDEEPEVVDYEAEPERGRGGSTFVLVALAVVFIAAAAVGTYMFISRNGLAGLPLIGGQFAAPVIVAEEPPAVVDAVPSEVGLSVLVSTAAVEASSRPVAMGKFIEVTVTAVDSYEATGTAEIQSAGRATGKLTVVNTTPSSYTFVATTRFLSANGVLFRMKQATVIPANGSVETEVYADQTGSAGDIGPGKFTIPGLPADLQVKIWGESSQSMAGGSATAKAVTVSDLASAKAELTERLQADSEVELAKLVALGEVILPELVTSEDVTSVEPEVGSVGAEFSLNVTKKFKALVVPEAEIKTLLFRELGNGLPEGQLAADFDLGQLTYVVEAYDPASGQAELRIQAPVVR